MNMPPACPRCGYDQSGAIAAWNHEASPSCPLHGTCSECGLDFLWRDIVSPVYSCEPFFFETAEVQRPRAFLTTLKKALRPSRFWSWVRMEHPIHPRRAITFALRAAVLLHGSLMALAFGLSLIGRAIAPLAGAGTPRVWSNVTASHGGHLLASATVPVWNPGYPHNDPWLTVSGSVSVLVCVLTPPAYLLLPQTLRRAKVRRMHLFRIGIYSCAVFPLVLGLPVLLAGISDVLRLAAWIPPPGISVFTRLLALPFEVVSWLVWSFRAPVLLVTVEAWLLVWWTGGVRSYLRLPHAFAAAALLLTISTLLSALIVVLIPALSWKALA